MFSNPLSLMIAVFVLFFPQVLTAAHPPTVVNVGIYAPFSEKNAYIGRNILAAVEMGRDRLKSSNIQYAFYTLDHIADNKKAAQTLQKFINVHHLNVLLTEGKENGLVAAPLAQKNHLIHFSLARDAAIADGKNNFLALNQKSTDTQAMKPEFIQQFKQEYINHPAIIAGYAYDTFNLLNQSAVLAMNVEHHLSNSAIAKQMHVLAVDKSVSDKNSALYSVAQSDAGKNNQKEIG